MKTEAVDMVATAVEKFSQNYEVDPTLIDLGRVKINQGINGQESRKFLACYRRRRIWI